MKGLTFGDVYKSCNNCGRMIDSMEGYCDKCKEELKDCSNVTKEKGGY